MGDSSSSSDEEGWTTVPPSKANEGRAPQIGPPEPVETGRAKSPETATKLWAVMAIDVENYVKTNVHVKTALDEFSRLPAEQREFFEKNVLGSLIDWQRILLHIGTSKDTEWDALMAVLLTALGEQDVTDSIDLIMRSSDCSDQMQPGCRDIGKRLRDRVKADIKCLQDSQYLPEMRKLKAFGPQGLPAGKVHVVCVSDERPLRGEALKERHSHIEHKLRDCAKAGLLTDEEVSEALLKQLVEKTWPDKSTDSKFPSRTFSDEDGIEYLSDVMAEAAEIEDRESQQYWEGVCEDFFVRFPEARDMKDEITHGEDALRYAMQDVVRRQIKRTAAETRNMDFISEAGVKADAIIHELSLRLVPKSLIVVSNDTDFFQVWNHESFIAQLKVNGRLRKDGACYGLGGEGDYGMAFAFRCALIGKQRGEEVNEQWREYLTGNAYSATEEKVELEERPNGEPWRLKRDTRKVSTFVTRACNEVVWRHNSLRDIIEWLHRFSEEAPGIRCRFLINVLAHNIDMAGCRLTLAAGGEHVVLDMYEREYPLVAASLDRILQRGQFTQQSLLHLCKSAGPSQ